MNWIRPGSIRPARASSRELSTGGLLGEWEKICLWLGLSGNHLLKERCALKNHAKELFCMSHHVSIGPEIRDVVAGPVPGAVAVCGLCSVGGG